MDRYMTFWKRSDIKRDNRFKGKRGNKDNLVGN